MFKPRYLAWLICVAMLPLSGCDQKTVANAMGAAAPATPAANTPAYTPLSADQLYQLVSPVALFPDKLLAQVLAGAGYPDQIGAADAWLAQNRGLQPAALTNAADAQPWDPSVRGLVQFPDVLDQMAKNRPWTTALGSAYLNDPTDVMNAIQVMRQRAAGKGTLKTSPQQRVVITPAAQQPYPQTLVAAPAQTIVIEPSQPDVIYVPHYDPWVAYGEPVPAYPDYRYQTYSSYSSGDMLAAGAISFGVGIAVGALINQHNNGWHSWDVHWNNRRQPVVYNNAPYISHSTTVINRVTNINQYNNVNRSNTVNNYNNATANPAPHFAPPVAHPAYNAAPTPQPHFAPPPATNPHQPMTMPAFAHMPAAAPQHPAAAPTHLQQKMNGPALIHPAPTPTRPEVKAATAHPAENRTMPAAVQHVAAPPAAPARVFNHPATALERPAQMPQPVRPIPHQPPTPQQQPHLLPIQHRQEQVAKPQEQRPVKVEEHKVP
ncbi:Protein of uncharacterised function (DUF3300) [Serratia entomophila]|uniref:DUF3300 domain-containing protein n=1 Tax=Serratia entomophila TaxID=42906 RepID=UPI0021774CDF|nr:DUF3300 domain-containing protein [Serratia entomophila]CAI0748217.1 Protein of uncharacterised function (DUF3300) [Serratia entomophila]CAI0760337.1 Protein of uncharacterised function (DUF3300) [Serratia entomophila]CAI2066751.1 Protein of uncharacterised function (DUF3300) [Serratia entomophila]